MNESSTNPARRGLNTASPSATRRTASASSRPSIVLVAYPRAPALIVAITSSAASDTLSARKTGASSPKVSVTPRNTETPPPAGMWTSRSTTSGRSRVMAVIESATVPASPTTCSPGSLASSARTPERNTAWSSTRNTRHNALCASGPAVAFSFIVPSRGRSPRRCVWLRP
ncbi:Uncharacterised protein [Mycobacteroides abscessus subsp. abscessus]|nr:Uncharacterised protein [Mycobacteroides abscessus subsp. abscessus]